MSFGTAKKASFPTSSRVVSDAPIIVSPRRESVKGDDHAARASSSLGLRTKSSLGENPSPSVAPIKETSTSTPTPLTTSQPTARSISRMALKAGTPVLDKAKKEEKDAKPKEEKVTAKSPKKSTSVSPTIKNKQTITRWYTLWNNYSLESLLSYIDQHTYHDHSDQTKYNVLQTKIKEIIEMNIKWEIVQMIAEGDQVSVICSLKGTGTCTPSWCEFFRLADNRIIERWGLPYTTLVNNGPGETKIDTVVQNNSADVKGQQIQTVPNTEANASATQEIDAAASTTPTEAV